MKNWRVESFSMSCMQVVKAYRKLAMRWHPDKYDGDDKAMAEQKFIDIAAAKEVLTDEGEWQGNNNNKFIKTEV